MEKIDVERKGYITPSDFRNYLDHKEGRIRHLFDKLDANKDNLLGREEIESALAELGIEGTDEVIENLFRTVDKGGSSDFRF
jgi:Ca2+-binding EF-hand superfamily protein